MGAAFLFAFPPRDERVPDSTVWDKVQKGLSGFVASADVRMASLFTINIIGVWSLSCLYHANKMLAVL
jgi:hypothetical protein